MKYNDAWWLWCLVAVVPLCLTFYSWGAWQRKRQLARVMARRLHDSLLQSVSGWRRGFKAMLFCLAVAALFVVLARPQFGLREITVDRSGVDFLIALDISRSMLAEDMNGTNRLAAAKEGIVRLVDGLTGDRVGLIIFAGNARLVTPFTRDHVAFKRSLEAVNTRSLSDPGTDIAAAIRLASTLLTEADYASKALVVVSDGEQLQGDAIIAAREAAAKQVKLFTVGVGSSGGARLPNRQGRQLEYVQNEFGRAVVSRFDRRALQQIAANGRGLFEPLGAQGEGLQAIYDHGLSRLATGKEKRKLRDYREYFQWPLGLAIALILLEMIVSERKRVKLKPTTAMKISLLGWIALAALPLSVGAADELRAARELLDQKQPDQAAVVVRQLLTHEPADPWLTYNLGVTAYAAGNYAEADRIWQDLATVQLPGRLWPQVWTQIGNASFRLGEPLYESTPEQTMQLWERSCEAYRVVLSESRRHMVAKPNLGLVEAKLAKLKIRLADQLAEKAQKQSLETKIESLQAALDYYQEAEELTPEDPQLEPKISQTDRQLRESLNQYAEKEEKRGDQNFAAKSSWADRQAEKNYQEALTQFERAAFQENEAVTAEKPPEVFQTETPADPATQPDPLPKDPEVQKAQEGSERVADKLAGLYTRMGRQHQQKADSQAQSRPDQAAEDYQEALDDFAQALAMNPEHEDAQRGEEEVRAALEKLHMEQGRQEMQAGMKSLQQKNEMRAVGQLQDALFDFHEAQTLNPQNQEAESSIEQIQEILPGLLAAIGQEEQAQAAKAEPKSVERAIEHLERAEASFDKALQVLPEHPPSQLGQQQTQADLNRLRQQIAAQLEQQAQQRQNQQRQSQQDQQRNAQPHPQPDQAFDQMLADLKPEEAQRQYEQNRLQNSENNRSNQRKHTKTW